MNKNRETFTLEQEELDLIKYNILIKSSFTSNRIDAMVILDLDQAKETFKNAMEIYKNFDKTLEKAIKFGKETGMDERYEELNKDFSEYTQEDILEKKKIFIEITIFNLGICEQDISEEIEPMLEELKSIKDSIVLEQKNQLKQSGLESYFSVFNENILAAINLNGLYNAMPAMKSIDLQEAEELFKETLRVYNNFDNVLKNGIEYTNYKEEGKNKDFSEYSKEEILEKKIKFIQSIIGCLKVNGKHISKEIQPTIHALNGMKNLIISEQKDQKELSLQSKSDLIK